MTNMTKSSQGILIGLLLLVVGCVSLVSLCGWFLTWCMSADLPIKHIVLMTGVLGIGLLTLIWRAWRTYRCMNQLIDCARVPLPLKFQTEIAEYGLDPNHIVLVQSSQPFALCFGFLRPRICLSSGLLALLSQRQVKAALQHEDYHRQRFDPLRLLLADAIAAALLFLPIVREWHVLFKIKLELDADNHAIQKTDKAALAGALHRILSYGSVPSPLSNSVTAGLNANAARIAALLGERSTTQQVSGKSILASMAVLWILCSILMV